jgi:uncharacterized protein (DUF488 family)
LEEILTVGHSTHDAGSFVSLLRGAGIEALADVRRFPGSRRMPWFNEGTLRATLAEAGIAYLHLPELGGRRSPVPGSANAGWRVGQFQGYADHMASEEFAAGLERLIAVASERRTAVMCAEALWWHCHRRLLSDALLALGWRVVHVGPTGRREQHGLTEFAVVEGERVTYPPAQLEL